jgi:hypothetical protein
VLGGARKWAHVMELEESWRRLKLSGAAVRARTRDAEISNYPVGKTTTCHVETSKTFSTHFPRNIHVCMYIVSYPVVQHPPRRTTSVAPLANTHLRVPKAPQRACGVISAAPAGRCRSAYLTPAVQCIAYSDNMTRTFRASGWCMGTKLVRGDCASADVM